MGPDVVFFGFRSCYRLSPMCFTHFSNFDVTGLVSGEDYIQRLYIYENYFIVLLPKNTNIIIENRFSSVFRK